MHLGKFFTIRVLLITALALLVLLIGAFVLAFVGFPIIVKLQVHKTVQLQTDTIQWDRFKKQPIDFAFKLHVFNVTNAYDVQNYGVLPDVSELGPYHFTQSLERNISYIGDESVTYTQIRKVIFDDKNSGSHKKTDRVKIPNPALVVITQITSTIERIFAYGCLDMILPPNMREPFIDTDIETLAINGLVFGRDTDVKGPSCSIVRNLFIKRARLIKCVDVIENSDGSVKELRFSMLNFMQSKIDGIYTINRGINDINQLGNLMKWDGEDRFKYWGNPRSIDNDKCNIVRGTDGTIYPPQITTDKTFDIFQSDVCRLITISYNGTRTYKGIDGYVFTIGPNSLRSDYADPEQDCYCTKSTADQTGNPSCFLDGVIDAQPCFHAPLILSWPHFLYAEDYRNGVTGLAEPDPEVHKTFILVEPNTGTPLEGFKRVQFNFILRPVQFMPMTKNHPRTLIPFTWLEQGVSLTDELIDELDNKYFGQIRLVNGVKYGLIALFAAFFCINFVFLLRKKYCTKK